MSENNDQNPLNCRDSIGCIFFALIAFLLIFGGLCS